MKWNDYVRGSANRQDFWERALEWVSGDMANIPAYMSKHRHDDNIDEVKDHFNNVIDWVADTFTESKPEMKGLEWGRLYNTYKDNSYNPEEMAKKVKALYGDSSVHSRKGIWEYLLGGSKKEKLNLLDIRFFDDRTKKVVYTHQTEKEGKSNCSYCAIGEGAAKTKIWKLSDMDADHIEAWSKGGQATEDNCEMLCEPHNRAKGNK
jgi:hypothetical protein